VSAKAKCSFRLKTGHTLPQALAIARDLTQKRFYEIGNPELANELAELGYPGDAAMNKALLIALGEVTPEHYRPSAEPHKIPGIPFIWNSDCFERRMYLKFKILGTKHKPTLWWYSCHEVAF
jgi:hypothetical protein